LTKELKLKNEFSAGLKGIHHVGNIRLSKCQNVIFKKQYTARVVNASSNALLRPTMSDLISEWCPSCCSLCFPFRLDTPRSDSPFSLRNLCLGGTLTLDKARVSISVTHQNCPHKHEEDDWHIFRSHWVITCLDNPEELALIRSLDFLIQHNFIRATCRGDQDGRLIIRIYLVQFDLSNVQGRLRVRKENVLSSGRRHMHTLLPKLSQSHNKWKGLGKETIEDDRHLVNNTIVCLYLFLPC